MINIEINEEALGRKVYRGSPGGLGSSVSFSSAEGNVARHGPPALLRQDVRHVFGDDIQALNDAIFQQTEDSVIDPVDLNQDVDLLLQNLSERLSDDGSRSHLHEFAEAARDPLREGLNPDSFTQTPL